MAGSVTSAEVERSWNEAVMPNGDNISEFPKGAEEIHEKPQ
jgi:hypothetical protein